MTTRLTGEIAKNYVDNLGGSLEAHEPDETCFDVYFDAELGHPDHEANLNAARFDDRTKRASDYSLDEFEARLAETSNTDER